MRTSTRGGPLQAYKAAGFGLSVGPKELDVFGGHYKRLVAGLAEALERKINLCAYSSALNPEIGHSIESARDSTSQLNVIGLSLVKKFFSSTHKHREHECRVLAAKLVAHRLGSSHATVGQVVGRQVVVGKLTDWQTG